MIIRAKFTKTKYLKYISHLDLMRLFHRAINRGKIPLKYSEGFNPQPKISIANPLALGIDSIAEYIDMEIVEDMDLNLIKERIQDELPHGIDILSLYELEDSTSLSSLIKWSVYKIDFTLLENMDKEDLATRIDEWLAREELIINKIKYKKGKERETRVNIRPLIDRVETEASDENILSLIATLRSGDSGNLRILDFVGAFVKDLNIQVDDELTQICRIEQLIGEEKIKIEG